MMENTDNNVPEQTRQSKDYSVNFNVENTLVQREASFSDDSEVFCTGLECEKINENQKQEKCSKGDLGKSVFRKNNSISSIHSCDSGYGSTKVFSISENDEENKQTDVNFK